MDVDAPPRALLQKARAAFGGFARVVRTYRLYDSNNATLVKMLEDLHRSFTELLEVSPELVVSVRPEVLIVDEQPVLEAPGHEDSVPFALYRDGIRRLDLSRGLSADELEALVQATSLGLHFAGIGDDIVSLLWRRDLAHVNYLVVDTTIVASEGGGPRVDEAPAAVDAQINALLRSLYGHGVGDASMSLHLDGADLPAKVIADALSEIDEMAPGLRPLAQLPQRPVYADAIDQEIAEEGEFAISVRGLEGALQAFGEPLPGHESQRLADALLRMLDTALLEDRFQVATGIVQGVRGSGQTRALIGGWMDEVVSEARFRHVAAAFDNPTTTEEVRASALDYFRACGAWAVEPLLALLPNVTDSQLRRALSNLLLEIGIIDLAPVQVLLQNEQAHVAIEAIYILAHLPDGEGFEGLLEGRRHPNGQVRAAVVENAAALGKERAFELVTELIQDSDPKVRVAAVKTLARMPGVTAIDVVEDLVDKASLEGAPFDLKRAALDAYAQLAGPRAVQPLHRFVREGDGFLSGRDAEETAIAACSALARIRTVAAVEILKRTAASRNKRLKETAKRALLFMKERA